MYVCVYVCSLFCMHRMCVQCLWRPIEGIGLLELQLQLLVSPKNKYMVISVASCLRLIIVLKY